MKIYFIGFVHNQGKNSVLDASVPHMKCTYMKCIVCCEEILQKQKSGPQGKNHSARRTTGYNQITHQVNKGKLATQEYEDDIPALHANLMPYKKKSYFSLYFIIRFWKDACRTLAYHHSTKNQLTTLIKKLERRDSKA